MTGADFALIGPILQEAQATQADPRLGRCGDPVVVRVWQVAGCRGPIRDPDPSLEPRSREMCGT